MCYQRKPVNKALALLFRNLQVNAIPACQLLSTNRTQYIASAKYPGYNSSI